MSDGDGEKKSVQQGDRKGLLNRRFGCILDTALEAGEKNLIKYLFHYIQFSTS